MTLSAAKARLDASVGETDGYITPADHKASYDDLAAAWTAADAVVAAAAAAAQSAASSAAAAAAGAAATATAAQDVAANAQDTADGVAAQLAGGYGDHLVTWNGSNWRYRGASLSARPAGVATHANGGRVVWDSSLHASVTDPPEWAVAGDVWCPHGEVVP